MSFNTKCPPLKTYTPAEQTAVGREIDTASANAVWPKFVTDYGTLRAECRAIK